MPSPCSSVRSLDGRLGDLGRSVVNSAKGFLISTANRFLISVAVVLPAPAVAPRAYQRDELSEPSGEWKAVRFCLSVVSRAPSGP
jgi:hypothetical protein